MRFTNKKNGFASNITLAINFFLELIIFMLIFTSIGILVQSMLFTGLGFLISVILTMLLNFFKVKAGIVYLVSLPVLIILLVFIPKVLI